jgi:hypothetical protein
MRLLASVGVLIPLWYEVKLTFEVPVLPEV